MIYFVRHGESEANQRGVFAGQKENSPLTQKGRDQAKITGQLVKSEIPKIDKIITSSLKRTHETAKIIAEEINYDISDIIIDDHIIEYDMGSLTGTPIKSISSMVLISAENAEDPKAFHDRVYLFLKELSTSEEVILLVSSAGVGRMLETIKQGREPALFYDLPAYENASLRKIDWF